MTWECDAYPGYLTFVDTKASQLSNSITTAAVLANQVVTLPQDSPFADYLWKGSCNTGQLTPKGADQQRRLGQDLRQIYIDRLKLLPGTFDPTAMHLRSTDVWRTKQSAENLMIGLYGQEAQAQGQPQPVFQIHTLPKEIDYMTMNTDRCPRIKEIIDAIKKKSEVLQQISRTHATFQKQVNQIVLGSKQEQNWENQDEDLVVMDLVDTILPRVCHDMPLQCVGGDDEHQELRCLTKEMADECLVIEAEGNAEMWRDAKGIHEMLQLGIGSLTRDIQKNFLEAAAPFLLYSGHDTTLLPLLGMLDSADMRWPPYASNLIFELWSSPSKERFVRVLYNGRAVKTKSNWCDLEWCPLDTVVKYMGQFIVDNLGARCKRHEQEF
ncbi:Acid phosphatase-like protein 2 [Dissophora ornata]|nr:Acid phosphatase-like protein 2 [Dissophora ornata]